MRNKILKDLNILYKQKRFEDFRRKYTMGKWTLSENDIRKCDAILSYNKNESIVELAISIMGGEIIE